MFWNVCKSIGNLLSVDQLNCVSKTITHDLALHVQFLGGHDEITFGLDNLFGSGMNFHVATNVWIFQGTSNIIGYYQGRFNTH